MTMIGTSTTTIKIPRTLTAMTRDDSDDREGMAAVTVGGAESVTRILPDTTCKIYNCHSHSNGQKKKRAVIITVLVLRYASAADFHMHI